MRYFKDGLKILFISLPYLLVNIGCTAGDLVDKSMINSLGASVIAAFGISATIGYIINTIPKLIADNSCVIVAREKDKKDNQIAIPDITTTAIVLTLIISVITVLIMLITKDLIVRLFSVDPVTDKLLGRLLLLRCVFLPINSISLVQEQYLASVRQNKLLLVLDIIFYILLILGDVIALWLNSGGEGIFIATIICYVIFVVSVVITSDMKIGKVRKSIAKEIIRTTLDMIPDRLGQRIAYTLQTKLASSFGTEGYAIVVVASAIRDIYEKMCNGLASGWSVYACEWLTGARDELKTIYTKEKSIIKQAFYYTAVSILFIVVIYVITIYPMWFLFGRVFTWDQCWYAILVCSLYMPQYLLYRSYYYLLRASGETRCLSLTAIVGGCCVRVPVQLLLVYSGGQVGALAVGQVLDFTARAVYLRFQVKKSKVLY